MPSLAMLSRLPVVAVFLFALGAAAQPTRTLTDDDWCDDASDPSRHETVCEVRETVVTARSLDIDASPNGGIKVKTWDRPDVLVRARVRSHAPSHAQARRLVDQTRVRTSGGSVHAETPDTRDRNTSITVSYEVFAPSRTDLALETVNGGVAVDGVRGAIEVRAINGGISLRDVSGSVRAHTTNGGVSVALARDTWDGDGLDVRSTNGGISLVVPASISARLSAETRMGRVSTDGLTLRDEDRQRGRWTGDRVEATLGGGGPPFRLATTNGGVSIRAR